MLKHAAGLGSHPSRLAWENDLVYVLTSCVNMGIILLMLVGGFKGIGTTKDFMTDSHCSVLCLHISHLSVCLHFRSSIPQFLMIFASVMKV